MRGRFLSATAVALMVLGVLGCSGKGGTPLTPASVPDITIDAIHSNVPSTHLWGYYDVYVDILTQTATAVLNRDVMFAANVVQFLNGKASNVQFVINGTPLGAGYVDVDIDVKVTHPFPGLPQYNGYDVRGVFIGNGSLTLNYNPELRYASHDLTVGPDQEMRDFGDIPGDPHPGTAGNPDGYTRWYNPTEFTTPGLFGYTPGMFASSGYTATALLNPYKYFADGLNAGDDLWTYLTNKTALEAVFSSGTTNTRNYYLRFPSPSPGKEFSYAVVANWINETTHPAHAPEACGLNVTVTPNVYFVSDSDKGGNLILDMSFPRTFGEVPSNIYIESDVLNYPHQMTGSEMIPTGGGSSWSTYHVEIPADNVISNSNTAAHEFWVIPEYDAYDYKNTFGVANGAGDDKLAAFFRYDLFVSPVPLCKNLVPTVSTLNGVSYYIAYRQVYTNWTIVGGSFEDGTPGVALNDGATDVAFGTSVHWVDSNNITFDIDLTSVPPGLYNVVVINGCGLKKRGTGVGMLRVLRKINVVGTPNVDIVTGYGNPQDIAVDPVLDQSIVAYNSVVNFGVWTNHYTTYSPLNCSWAYKGNVDCNSTRYHFSLNANGLSSPYNGCSGNLWGVNSNIAGTFDPYNLKDVANLQGADQFWGIRYTSTDAYWHMSDTTGGSSWSYGPLTPPFFNGSGTTGVMMDYVRAIDLRKWTSGPVMMYFLEIVPSKPTCVVELWSATVPPVYQNVSFGEDLFYKAMDITVDSNDIVYVLDNNATARPTIYAFDSNGEWIGTSGVIPLSAISGFALRIDAALSTVPNEVHVLHTLGVTRFSMP